jgi:hypothetical protein
VEEGCDASQRRPVSYALRGRGCAAKSVCSSGVLRRPSAESAGRAFVMVRSGSVSVSLPSSAAAVGAEGSTEGSTETWTTREWARRSSCAGKRASPVRRE